VRKDSLARLSVLRDILNKLHDAISSEEMRRLNYEVDGKKRKPADVVREWLAQKGF